MEIFIKPVLFFVIFIALSFNLQGFCEDPDKNPSVGDLARSVEREHESDGNIGAWFASIFRDHISGVDGDRCPSIPSCSSYSVAAFKKHGFFIGWVMTVDRLIHEANEASVSPVVYHKGRFKILDPVENNDFWWVCKDGSEKK